MHNHRGELIFMFNKKNKLILTILLMLFAIIFFYSAYTQREQMLDLYESGTNKIYAGEYQEAQEIFGELGDYKDSLDLMKNAQNLEQQKQIYDRAVELFSDEKYEDSIDLFAQVEDFKDSKEYIETSNTLMKQRDDDEYMYNEAYSYYESDNYILAIRKFTELNGYKDSENVIRKCRLELAKLQQATTISAGIRSSVGMIRQGKVYLSGDDYYSWKSELDSWNDIISISVKGNFVVGLKDDGAVVMAGKIPYCCDFYWLEAYCWFGFKWRNSYNWIWKRKTIKTD